MAQPKIQYDISRPIYSLTAFDAEFQKANRTYPLGEKIRNLFRCPARRFKALLLAFFPVIIWLPKYKIKECLMTDVLGGISSGTIQVPQGMAFALLANLPPVNGLYSSFFPLIPYFFMGTIHQLVPGTFAVLSIIVGNMCLQLAPESEFQHFNVTLNKIITDVAEMQAVRLRLSGTLACLTAIIQVGLGIMQFGFVAIYLSESFIRGFMTAAGLQIFISVLKYIFGLQVPPYSGPLATIYTVVDILKNLPHTNIASLVFALVSAMILIIVKELNLRYKHKIPFPIPVEIAVVTVATAISRTLNLPEKYNIDIVGAVPQGLPAPMVPEVTKWGDMIGTAFSLAIIGYVINLAMGRTLATKHGYDIDPNQEMLALGCSNFFGSFFYTHVICCALSVTLAVDGSGGKSQVASFCVMAVVLVTLLTLGVYLQPLPKSVLGALIAVNLKNSLVQLSDPYYLWKKNRLDCCVWIVSFLSAFVLGLSYGVPVGVGFSMLMVIFQTQFRNGSSLGQVSNMDIYKNPKVYTQVKELKGIKVLTYCSPIYFANAEIFRRKIFQKSGVDPVKYFLAKRKFIKMQTKERRQKEGKRSQHNIQNKTASLSSLQGIPTDTAGNSAIDSNNNHRAEDTASTCYVICNTSNIISEEVTNCSVTTSGSENNNNPILNAPPFPDFHTLILDMAAVSFMDLMGIKVLGKLHSSYQNIGVNVYLANVQAQVYTDIENGGLFQEGGLERSHLFLTTHDAVLFLQHNQWRQKQNQEPAKTLMSHDSYGNESLLKATDEEEDIEQAMFGSMFNDGNYTSL
ncbi:solute carrier family 26 member 9 [Protopterus annectens]|uniref:solute carrier family 26 member 9 n=1 Tax=Protopterus annectens TaxID=7888 RepID=UPI001CFBA0C8|nr:solute carrier family 26 member 9 [Protopterus annectens]